MPFSKYSKKQKKLARVRPPRNKITKPDTQAVKRKTRRKYAKKKGKK